MQQFFDNNKELIALIAGTLINSILSLVFRTLPTNHWAIQLFRIVLQSGNSFGNQAEVIANKAGTTLKVTGVSLLCGLLLITGCASTQIKGVSATDSDGDKYAVCFKVIQHVAPISTRLVFMGCANAEQDVAAVEEQAKAIAAVTANSEVRKVQAK